MMLSSKPLLPHSTTRGHEQRGTMIQPAIASSVRSDQTTEMHGRIALMYLGPEVGQ
jgi:hypothetical protein